MRRTLPLSAARYFFLVALLLLGSPYAAIAATPIYGNYLANNGVDTIYALTAFYNDTTGESYEIAFDFTTPPDITYTVSMLEFTARLTHGAAGELSVQIESALGSPIGDRYRTSSPLPTTGPQRVSLKSTDNAILAPNTKYYVHLWVADLLDGLAEVALFANAAGDYGNQYHKYAPSSWMTEADVVKPAVRITGSATPDPAIKPAYSAFGTLGNSSAAVDATVFVEVICPSNPGGEFTCPLLVSVPAQASSVTVAHAVAAAINDYSGACWGDPDAAASFDAYVSGNIVRITNNKLGLCVGAFVCADHVELLSHWAMKKSMSYEYLDIGGPLLLQMRGTAAGVAADPAFANTVTLNYTSRDASTGLPASRRVDVKLPRSASGERIATAVAKAFQSHGNQSAPVVQLGPGLLQINPSPAGAGSDGRYDLAVRSNDKGLDWALSPFPNLLEVAEAHDPPIGGELRSPAHAILSSAQYRCQVAIGKEGLKFIAGEVQLRQRCIEANLQTGPGTCAAPDAGALQQLRDRMRAHITSKCTFPVDTAGNLRALGFPGQCSDLNPSDGFTVADLTDCIERSHEDLLTGVCGGGSNSDEVCSGLGDCPDNGPGTYCRGIITSQYDPSLTGPLSGAHIVCQKEVGKRSAKFLVSVMKSIQRCRNDLLNCPLDPQTATATCKLSGLVAEDCATSDQNTSDAIARAKAQAEAKITAKCSDSAVVTALDLCDPDQADVASAATCVTTLHQQFADNRSPGEVTGFIDYEYATPGRCGDQRLNQPREECDGVADAACPGLCGAASGYFACLCQDIPRHRVVEHAGSDLDFGWTGKSHDSGIVEGGGYVTDLWDCDGPGGPDTLCNIGPSCNLAPHQSCSPDRDASGIAADSNALCPGAGNFCRRTRAGSTGPHCEIEFNRRCDADAQCSTLGDHCVNVFRSAPLPLSSADGVAVCVVNVLSEDVVGTIDVATGASAVRLRQRSIAHLGPSRSQPCPVCGGFCNGTAKGGGPGDRTLCVVDADCPDSFCVHDHVCSYGPNIDRACRPSPPFGGSSTDFGNPSVDCPPHPGANISGPGLDILSVPATTAAISLTATQNCGASGFLGKTCVAGVNDKRPCTAATHCPGGSCNMQCFCPYTGLGVAERPNACNAACVGGASDAMPCVNDSECDPPNGFCHPGDCRVNPSDTDSIQEGLCTTGPTIGTCSISVLRACASNAECQSPDCPFCQPGETCVSTNRQCFVNGVINRAGVAGTPDRTSAAIFCIPATGAASVDDVAGLPGPGALTQPGTTIEVGF